MGVTPSRPSRRCARCGRIGRNAFRPVHAGESGQLWACTHEETCVARTRQMRRAGSKRANGRSDRSPIPGLDLCDKPACIIGSAPESAAILADALTELAAVDVECLDLSQRSLLVLGRREFGLVIADVHRTDPVALLDGLSRRLAGLARRGVPVVVCHPSNEVGPAVEGLVAEAGAHRLRRPVPATALLSLVGNVLGGAR